MYAGLLKQLITSSFLNLCRSRVAKINNKIKMTLQLLRKQFIIKKVKQLQAEQSCSQTKMLNFVVPLVSYLLQNLTL